MHERYSIHLIITPPTQPNQQFHPISFLVLKTIYLATFFYHTLIFVLFFFCDQHLILAPPFIKKHGSGKIFCIFLSFFENLGRKKKKNQDFQDFCLFFSGSLEIFEIFEKSWKKKEKKGKKEKKR